MMLRRFVLAAQASTAVGVRGDSIYFVRSAMGLLGIRATSLDPAGTRSILEMLRPFGRRSLERLERFALEVPGLAPHLLTVHGGYHFRRGE